MGIQQTLSQMQVSLDLVSAIVEIDCAKLRKNDPKTPAPKSDQVSGSDINPAGVASRDGGGPAIPASVEVGLSNKASEHNKAHERAGSRTSLATLKKVYQRGVGAYSTSHRPNVASREQWGLGRVNAFLHLLSTGSPKNPKYITDNDLLPQDHPRATRKA